MCPKTEPPVTSNHFCNLTWVDALHRFDCIGKSYSSWLILDNYGYFPHKVIFLTSYCSNCTSRKNAVQIYVSIDWKIIVINIAYNKVKKVKILNTFCTFTGSSCKT